MAALKFKNVTAPHRVKQRSSLIAHFDHRKVVQHCYGLIDVLNDHGDEWELIDANK